MQPLETGPDIWRRASPSPAPRPVLNSARATIPLTTQFLGTTPIFVITPSRTGAWVKRTSILVAAVLLASALSAAARLGNAAAPLSANVEHLLERAGFGLRQVSVTGHHYTADRDIFDALALERVRTVPLFDSAAAQRRVEQLPWVATASIARVLPDGIAVHVTERTPVAVWQLGARRLLIDASGRVLSPVPAGAALELPQIAGEGAAPAAGELLLLLGHHPALRDRLRLAERVGERRWTLRLSDGGSILLPADDFGPALVRAMALTAELPARPLVIDVRTDRTLISEAPQAQARGEAAAKAHASLPTAATVRGRVGGAT